MSLARIPVVLAALSLALVADAQDVPTKADRFKLYNLCAPIGVVIEALPPGVAAAGLSTTQLEEMAVQRLKTVALHDPLALTALHVAASPDAVQIRYRKPVVDVASSETEVIQTFSQTAEVRDGSAAGIMLKVSQLLDDFLIEYRRVNYPECNGGSAIPKPAVSVRSPDPVEPGEPIRPVGSRVRPSARSRPSSTDGIKWGRVWEPPEDPERTVRPTGNGISGPRLIFKVSPDYSEKARRLGVQGTVLLAIEVWQDGRPHNIRVLRSLGFGLDEKAIEAVEQWRFKPGEKDGVPVRVAAKVQVSFRLRVDDPRKNFQPVGNGSGLTSEQVPSGDG